MKKNTIDMPIISPVPFSSDCGYFKRIIRWFLYTREWRFEKNWYFKINDTLIMIPRNFCLDGASVPKPFRFLLSPTGILFIPGIIHDYGYKYDKLIGVRTTESGLRMLYDYHPGAGKAFWDSLFRQIGNSRTKLYIIPYVAYLSVKFFGFIAWHKHRKNQEKKT